MYFDQIAFGKRVKELREEMKLSQAAIAEKLNISRYHYGSIERGERGISIDLLLDLAELFHVSTDYLLVGRSVNRSEEAEQLQAVQETLTKLIRAL